MRDMGFYGSHYSMDFYGYENSYLSNFVKQFKKKYLKITFNLLQ